MNPGEAPAAALTSLRLGGVEEVLDASFVFYRRRFVACFVAMALVQLPVTIVNTLVSQTAWRKIETAGTDAVLLTEGLTYTIFVVLPVAFLSLAATHVSTGALCYLVGRACVGETVGVAESYARAFRRLLPLLGASLVVAFASIAGFLFFVVPGVLAFLVSFAAVPAVVLEERGVVDGLRRSYTLASGNLGRVTAVRLLIALFLLVCMAVGLVVADSLGIPGDSRFLAAQVLTLVAAPVDAISTVLLYYDLRVRREGLDLRRMADELGSEP